ncbi:hypothetical protein FGO68_gene17380 [Halteria grandinella]|uniref:Uncharacterized protein n=1 Tax=Halteria grandinella TaxID=5974 RepID=A0A8J8NQT9_HALGN|nr:hypothetical protein FGO68_gene17380 [Halteria grandinella]
MPTLNQQMKLPNYPYQSYNTADTKIMEELMQIREGRQNISSNLSRKMTIMPNVRKHPYNCTVNQTKKKGTSEIGNQLGHLIVDQQFDCCRIIILKARPITNDYKQTRNPLRRRKGTTAHQLIWITFLTIYATYKQHFIRIIYFGKRGSSNYLARSKDLNLRAFNVASQQPIMDKSDFVLHCYTLIEYSLYLWWRAQWIGYWWFRSRFDWNCIVRTLTRSGTENGRLQESCSWIRDCCY